MKDRLLLAAYLAAVVALTLVHDPRVLAAALAAVLLLCGRDAGRIAARAVRAVLVYAGLVSLAWAAAALVEHRSGWTFLLRLNLRVLTMTSLTLLLARRINLFRALAFSRSLLYVLTLAYSQVLGFRRLADDFRLALRSRRLGRLTLRQKYRHGAATATYFLRRSSAGMTEIAQAMRSRGFFDA